MPNGLFRALRLSLARTATALCLAASCFLAPAPASADDAPVAPASSPVQFDIHVIGGGQRHSVPYELARGIVVFKALVEGREVWALLDNRASRSLIDAAFARSLGLVLTPATERLVTPTGSMEGWTVPVVDITIPGQAQMLAPMAATDLSRWSALLGRPVSLILGKEYFDSLEFLFKPQESTFQLGPSGMVKLTEDTPHLVLRNDRPQVEVMIAMRPTVLTVDLGYGGEIAVGQDAWTGLGLDQLPSAPGLTADMSGRLSASAAARVRSVALGATPVENVKVTTQPTIAGDGDGMIGFALLSRYMFALDIQARRLWLIWPLPRE